MSNKIKFSITLSFSLIFTVIHTGIFFSGMNYEVVQVITLLTMGITASLLSAFTFRRATFAFLYGYLYMFIICCIILVIVPTILDTNHDFMYYLTDEDEGIGWSFAYLMFNSVTYLPLFFIFRFVKRHFKWKSGVM